MANEDDFDEALRNREAESQRRATELTELAEVTQPPRPLDPILQATLKPSKMSEPSEKSSVAEKATTVAAPTRGCPAPDFVKADIKAREVLEHFLTPEQLEDFRRCNRFVAVGGTTGHRSMVASANA